MKPSERRRPPQRRPGNAVPAAAPAEIRSPPDPGAGTGFVAKVEFRLLAEQSLVGIAIRDADSSLYVNGRFAEIFGYTRDGILWVAPDALVAEKDRARMRELLGRRREGQNRSGHYTYQGLRRDGTAVEIESYASQIEVGGKPATIMIVMDVTERKRAEEALRESRNLLQTVLDSIPSAAFWKDRNLVYLGGNRVFLNAVGLKSSDEIVGKSDYDLPWGREQAESYRAFDRKVIDSGIPEHHIIESYRQADDTEAWAQTNKVPLRDTEGKVIGILGTFEDITERKRAEEQARRQLDELRRWHEATLGREDRILELKGEVNALCARLGEAPRYASPGEAPPVPPGQGGPPALAEKESVP